MDLSRRRSSGGGGRGTPAGVVAGSVWESRMKIDQVSGGFKVFNGGEEESGGAVVAETSPTPTTPTTPATTRLKRIGTTPTTPTTTPTPKRKTWKSERSSPIQIGRSDQQPSSVKRSPIQAKRVVAVRSHAAKEIERSPVRRLTMSTDLSSQPKAKPEPEPESASNNNEDDDGDDDDVVVVEAANEEEREKSPGGTGSSVEEEEEEAVRSDDDDDDRVDDDEEIESVEIKEVETKEIKAEEEVKAAKIVDAEKKVVVEVVSEVKRVHFERKSEVRNQNIINNNNSKIYHQKQSDPISLNVNRPPSVIKRATMHSSFPTTRRSHPNSEAYHNFPETHNRLQSFVDLIMWKDISRSVFIFGIGTFTILSSSYTKDLNISFISVISYLGLVYLAAIFLFRSIVCRGVIDMDYTSYVVGEEEAIWFLRLVLPYLNEFLLKLKALFSGDPATTMKLAALLFILARCGSSITIWTMAKLGFFGVFTVPKVCSLYSTHITAYAKFWVRRFRDAWDSCSHKKGVTVAVFLLVWNLSSIIARIWAVFMLFVAFRYYQQTIVANDWVENGPEGEETLYEPIGVRKHGPGPTTVDHAKQKKRL